MRVSLAGKFTAILFTIILMASFMTGYIAYDLHKDISRTEIFSQFARTTDQVAARIDLRLQDVNRMSDQLVLNPSVIRIVGKSSSGDQLTHLKREELNEAMKPMFLAVPHLLTFYIFDNRSDYFTPSNTSISYESGLRYRAQIEDALEGTDGELVWMKGQVQAAGSPNLSNDVLLAARWLKDISMRTFGMLLVVMNGSVLANDLHNVIEGDEGQVYLFDQKDQLLYTDEDDPVRIDLPLIRSVRNVGIRTINGKSYLFARSATDKTKFKLVSRISLNKLEEKSTAILRVAWVSGLIGALIASGFVIVASRGLLRPLKDLVRGMRRVRAGDLEARIQIRTKDELSYLGDSFNSMVEHVNALIREVYEKQLRQSEAELAALQAQINPHFLYNTLDMIHSKLYLQDDLETASHIVSLSDLLRYSLEPVRTPTTLREEWGQVLHYLSLQKARYEDRLDLILEADEDVLECDCIRLLIQPLVENVFVHAFVNQTGTRQLGIRAFRQDSMLLIEIRDNGCGFDPDAVRIVRPGKKNSYGLNNVIRRIELMHGQPYGLEIESEPGTGTRIRVKLPYRLKEQEAAG